MFFLVLYSAPAWDIASFMNGIITKTISRDDYNNRIIDKAGKIPADEPVFLLRAQDKLAPSTLRYYAKLLEEDGNLEMAEELRAHARQMIVWQKSVKVKAPDK